MALTKRFFVELAREYKEARPAASAESTEFAVWMHCVTITANAMARQNGSFNYVRFYDAAGMPAEAVTLVGQRTA